MSTNTGSDAPKTTDAPAAPANGADAIGHKLLEDLTTKYSPVADPAAVQKLVADGVLPEGSTVIDFGALKTQLETDQRTLRDIQGQQPIDTKAAVDALQNAQGVSDAGKQAIADATTGVTDATTAQTAAQTTLDAANAKLAPLQQAVDDRNASDVKVQAAFTTVSTALNKGEIGDGELQNLVTDTTQPQEVRDAAQTLLNTIHDEEYTTGGKGGAFKAHRKAGDFIDNDFISFNNGVHFNADTIARGLAQHGDPNNADNKALESAKGEVAAAQTAKDAADTALQTEQTNLKARQDEQAAKDADLATRQDELNKLNDQNLALLNAQRTLPERIADEQAALASATPNAELEALGRVTKGGGYYQVAEALLGIPEGGHSYEDEKELKMLTRILQNEERRLNGGELPKYLKVGDQLLAPENLARVLSELAATLNPEPPAPAAEVPAETPPAGDAQMTTATPGAPADQSTNVFQEPRNQIEYPQTELPQQTYSWEDPSGYVTTAYPYDYSLDMTTPNPDRPVKR